MDALFVSKHKGHWYKGLRQRESRGGCPIVPKGLDYTDSIKDDEMSVSHLQLDDGEELEEVVVPVTHWY